MSKMLTVQVTSTANGGNANGGSGGTGNGGNGGCSQGRAMEEAVLVVMAVPTPEVQAVMAVPAVAAVQADSPAAVTAGFCQAGLEALVVPVVRGVRQPAQTQSYLPCFKHGIENEDEQIVHLIFLFLFS